LEKAAIFDPNAATNMPVHPLSLFPEIMEFQKQQNALDWTVVGETTGGGFETLGGDKTHCFISRTQAYN
jgi:hypothetical protein